MKHEDGSAKDDHSAQLPPENVPDRGAHAARYILIGSPKNPEADAP